MRYLYIIIAILFFIGLISCGDEFLELNPSDSLPPEAAIKSVSDVEAVLVGVYSQLQNSDYYGRYFVLTPDVMSDDVKQNSQANRAKDWAEYAGSVNDIHSIPEEIWTEVYEMVNRANTVINTPIEVPSTVQVDADQFLGEAYALRALGHFDLVRIFGQHYGFSGDNGHLGVPIVTEFDVNAEPFRNTVAEVYNTVIADLNQAITLMSKDRGVGFFSRDAAKALLARVYLYMSDYANAESMANDVISSGNFSLTGEANYIDTWMADGFSPDAILDVVNTPDDNNGSDALGRMYINEGYGDYLPSDDIYNLIHEEDARKQLFKVDSTIGGGEFGWLRMNKFPSVTGWDNTPILRLPEIYLIRAEARARRGDESGAIDDLMTVRRRAWPNAPDVNATGQALLDEIALEKRIELMFEGHRLWELMRHKEGVVRENCTSPVCEVSYPNDRFVLPIPIEEINANPNITQNPGY